MYCRLLVFYVDYRRIGFPLKSIETSGSSLNARSSLQRGIRGGFERLIYSSVESAFGIHRRPRATRWRDTNRNTVKFAFNSGMPTAHASGRGLSSCAAARAGWRSLCGDPVIAGRSYSCGSCSSAFDAESIMNDLGASARQLVVQGFEMM